VPTSRRTELPYDEQAEPSSDDEGVGASREIGNEIGFDGKLSP
jgi:hypothetical protein